MPRIVLAVVGVGLIVAAAVFWGLPRLQSPAPDVAREPSEETSASADDGAGRTITARLYFVAEDGFHLAVVEHEVPYGATTVEQASRIVQALLTVDPSPYTSAIPVGTTLRALFVSDEGDAYVDLTSPVVLDHPGGSLNEFFTVHALVNALTVNLPSIQGVQILVDGREVDTLAGHVDLRRPLRQDPRWLERSQPEFTSR